MTNEIVSFVLSGGIGSRLWPLSRADNPKQFHDLSGDGSMLLKTVRRLKARPGAQEPVYLIASEQHAERVSGDLASVGLSAADAIFEPLGRNTAAAVAVAALATLSRHGDALVLVVPSDHEITTDADFWKSVECGREAAVKGSLVVFGIKPNRPETGYGYIHARPADDHAAPRSVERFVEKPDLETAKSYVADGGYYWNSGIFLFRAGAMRDAFLGLCPEIWEKAELAFTGAASDLTGTFLPLDIYGDIQSISIDYAIMEHAADVVMVPATFRWNDLGSWQSLLDISPTDGQGNVTLGDVIAIDCENSYLRSQGKLLAVIGMKDVAIVATPDATFVAPVAESQNVKKIIEQLDRTGRLETKYTPAHTRVLAHGAWRDRVGHWLFEETLPLWSTAGIDDRHGGFHEVLGFDGRPLPRTKRTRTMARQIYAFSVAKTRGWTGPADAVIGHGIDFLATKGRTDQGGWVRALNADGSVADATEDAYDHACVLLALAQAHMAGHTRVLGMAEETFQFLDARLEDEGFSGYRETSAAGEGLRRSNPHMHLLEAFLAWYRATGRRSYLRRAARVIDLFRNHFFNSESWTLGEYFADDWSPAPGEAGDWTEPGHHFEWASLLVDFSELSQRQDLVRYARKLYGCAVANGLNRSTGLAYGAVSRHGLPLDRVSRSWPQAEAIKAAIALDGQGGPDLKPEIEERVDRLFRWHIDPAPTGLWIDRIDEKGRAIATEVPASIFYHLVCALMQYLDKTAERPQ